MAIIIPVVDNFVTDKGVVTFLRWQDYERFSDRHAVCFSSRSFSCVTPHLFIILVMHHVIILQQFSISRNDSHLLPEYGCVEYNLEHSLHRADFNWVVFWQNPNKEYAY